MVLETVYLIDCFAPAYDMMHEKRKKFHSTLFRCWALHDAAIFAHDGLYNLVSSLKSQVKFLSKN
jgi:hypothetical protein